MLNNYSLNQRITTLQSQINTIETLPDLYVSKADDEEITGAKTFTNTTTMENTLDMSSNPIERVSSLEVASFTPKGSYFTFEKAPIYINGSTNDRTNALYINNINPSMLIMLNTSTSNSSPWIFNTAGSENTYSFRNNGDKIIEFDSTNGINIYKNTDFNETNITGINSLTTISSYSSDFYLENIYHQTGGTITFNNDITMPGYSINDIDNISPDGVYCANIYEKHTLGGITFNNDVSFNSNAISDVYNLDLSGGGITLNGDTSFIDFSNVNGDTMTIYRTAAGMTIRDGTGTNRYVLLEDGTQYFTNSIQTRGGIDNYSQDISNVNGLYVDNLYESTTSAGITANNSLSMNSNDISDVNEITTSNINTSYINEGSTGGTLNIQSKFTNFLSDDGTEYLKFASVSGFWNKILSYSDDAKDLILGTISDTGTLYNDILFQIEGGTKMTIANSETTIADDLTVGGLITTTNLVADDIRLNTTSSTTDYTKTLSYIDYNGDGTITPNIDGVLLRSDNCFNICDKTTNVANSGGAFSFVMNANRANLTMGSNTGITESILLLAGSTTAYINVQTDGGYITTSGANSYVSTYELRTDEITTKSASSITVSSPFTDLTNFNGTYFYQDEDTFTSTSYTKTIVYDNINSSNIFIKGEASIYDGTNYETIYLNISVFQNSTGTVFSNNNNVSSDNSFTVTVSANTGNTTLNFAYSAGTPQYKSFNFTIQSKDKDITSIY